MSPSSSSLSSPSTSPPSLSSSSSSSSSFFLARRSSLVHWNWFAYWCHRSSAGTRDPINYKRRHFQLSKMLPCCLISSHIMDVVHAHLSPLSKTPPPPLLRFILYSSAATIETPSSPPDSASSSSSSSSYRFLFFIKTQKRLAFSLCLWKKKKKENININRKSYTVKPR